MHRAVVLTTLVLLLLAVAGVSAAQESGIFAAGPNIDAAPGSTTLERTSFGATVAEDPEKTALPGASSKPEDGEDISGSTVLSEPTVGETGKPTVVAPVEETLAAGPTNVGKPGNSGQGVGKPFNMGEPRDDVGRPGNGKPEERGLEEEHGLGGGQPKVTVCHKGKKTLTVGKPALAAHKRHGDREGACETEGAGTKPSGETMGSEAARNGGGGSGGRTKVTLCHKGKITVTVGAPAWAAHQRHGDILGAYL